MTFDFKKTVLLMLCGLAVVCVSPSLYADLYKYRTGNGDILVTTERRPQYKLIEVISDPSSAKSKRQGYSDPSTKKRQFYKELIEEAAQKYDLPPSLIEAVIRVESNYNPNAISSAGAQGLMQLMPKTAEDLGVKKPFNPRENIFGGSKLLSNLVERYDGDIELVLAAYNAGDAAVQRHQGIPYPQTREYVKMVSHWFRYYYDERRK